jgi:pilus assembly protein CpaF
MSEHGELTDGTDRDVLARDATRELLGLGPLELLLHANEVREIHILHPDCVLARTSAGVTRRERSFTSETALARVVARLAQRSGEPRHPGEIVIERRLSRGATMTAVAPPAASGWVVHIQKVRRLESSLGELLGAGAISDTVNVFLEACAGARLNVLLSGPDSAAVETVLAAFASAAPAGELVAVLEPPADQLAIPAAHVISLALHEGGDTGARAVQIAARLGVDRVVVTSLNGPVGAAAFDLVAEGRVCVLGAVVAPSLLHGLARLVATVALARPGATVAAIREVAGHSFDLAIEVDRSGGVVGVKRIAELDGSDARGVGLQDLFTRKAGSGEASYLAAPVSAKLAGRLRSHASSRPDHEGASADAR